MKRCVTFNILQNVFRSLQSKLAKLSLLALVIFVAIQGGSLLASLPTRSQPAVSGNCQPVSGGKLYRYLEGEDSCLRPLSNEEIEKLTDPLAMGIFRQGIFPESAEALSLAIADKLGDRPTSFLVGEGTQIPTTVASREAPRSLRYVVTWGESESDSKIMMGKAALSTLPPIVDAISFDYLTQEYNYYSFRPQVGAEDDENQVWAWVGNTSRSRSAPTRGQGCFRCHHNGLPVMRELELPWNNWHSQRAAISSNSVPESVTRDRFFQQRLGAQILEKTIKANVQSFYQTWVAQQLRQKDSITIVKNVDEMLRHLTQTTTLNFTASNVQSHAENTSPVNQNITGVPPRDTFLSDTIFQDILGLDYSSLFVTLPRQKYDAYLKRHHFKLVASQEFPRGLTRRFSRETAIAYELPGATYFAYFLPQVPFEDFYVTKLLLDNQIVTEKFVAAILMVDFKQPLFSEKRGSLQKYAQQIAIGGIVNGLSSIPTDFAAKIKATGATACDRDNFERCSAEEQFLYTWELPDSEWKQVTSKRLQAHVNSIKEIDENARLDYLMRWSVQQGDRFASTPLFCEFFDVRLFLPETDLSQLSSCPKTVDR